MGSIYSKYITPTRFGGLYSTKLIHLNAKKRRPPIHLLYTTLIKHKNLCLFHFLNYSSLSLSLSLYSIKVFSHCSSHKISPLFSLLISAPSIYHLPPPCQVLSTLSPQKIKKPAQSRFFIFYSFSTTLICISFNCCSVTVHGAPINASCAFLFLGKAITSLIFGSFAINITILSNPGAAPA